MISSDFSAELEKELGNFWATFPFLVVHDVKIDLDNYRVQADQSAPLIVGDRSIRGITS